MLVKKSACALTMLVSGVLAVASIAWACTPSPLISVTSAGGGTSAQVINVEGSNFAPKSVDLRWNDLSGPVVGVAEGPEFVAQATVPQDTEPGVYFVLAVQTDAAGTVETKAAETFVVGPRAADSSQSTTGELWSGLPAPPLSTESQIGFSPENLGLGAGLLALGAAMLAGAAITMLIHGRRRSAI